MDFSKVTSLQKADLLICFADIQGFLAIAKALPDSLQLFELLQVFASTFVKGVESTGGRVIKFIGDSCLLVYPEDKVDKGILEMRSLKEDFEAYLKKRGFSNKLSITCHYGEAAIGLYGEGQCRGLDVLGESVNTASSLGREHRGKLVVSPQVFRKLSPATRKHFHKHTPPITYLAEV